MNHQTTTQKQSTPTTANLSRGRILQRQCDSCGQHRIGGDCSKCAQKKHKLQRQLTIGASHTALEQEADRVANQVMGSSGRRPSPPGIHPYREEAIAGTEPAPASVHQVLSSPGSILEPILRQEMEQRFGYDFSQVRIHTGAAAERSAQAVSANAYTVGHNIVFGAGQFTPGTPQGQRLIAHELTHVVQQGSADSGLVQRQPTTDVHASTPGALRANVPYEKQSPTAEAAYRKAGLIEEANAVLNCRELGQCAKVLAEAEAYAAYRSGRINAGMEEPKPEKGSGPPVAALAGGATAPLLAPGAGEAAKTVGKSALEKAAARWGTAEVISGGAAAVEGGAAASVATVAVPIALGIYLTIAVVDLVGYGKFQSALRKQGYVILPAPLGVCIGNCHQPSAPTEKWKPSPFLPTPQPWKPGPISEEERKRIEDWLRPEASRKQPKAPPAPVPVPPPAPAPVPPKSSKCSDTLVEQLNKEMHKSCDQPRSCSIQGDTCQTATAKVAAGQGCVRERIELQQKCFSKGDPKYEGHMKQIAEANAVLRQCMEVMSAKC